MEKIICSICKKECVPVEPKEFSHCCNAQIINFKVGMNKNCEDCKNSYVNKNDAKACILECDNGEKFQPIESKIYFENEKEAYAHYFEKASEVFPEKEMIERLYFYLLNNNMSIEEREKISKKMTKKAYDLGYIKKSKFQKAKDDFNKYYADNHNDIRFTSEVKNYVDLMEKVIENQLNEIVKLKKILQMYD